MASQHNPRSALSGDVHNTFITIEAHMIPKTRRKSKITGKKRKRLDSVTSGSPRPRKAKPGTVEGEMQGINQDSAPLSTPVTVSFVSAPSTIPAAVEEWAVAPDEPRTVFNDPGIEKFRALVHIDDVELKTRDTYVQAVQFLKSYDGPLPFSDQDYVALRRYGRALQDGEITLPALPTHLRKYASQKLYIKRVSKHDEIHYGGTDMQENNRLLAALGMLSVSGGGNDNQGEGEIMYKPTRPMDPEEEDKDPLNGSVRRIGGLRLVFVGELLNIMHMLVYGARYMEDTRMNRLVYEGLPQQFVDKWMVHSLYAGLYSSEKRSFVPSMYSKEVSSKMHANWVAKKAVRVAATEAILERIEASTS